jgi:DNA-damage-inducible protein J
MDRPHGTVDREAYDAWVSAKVHEAMKNARAPASHDQVMAEAEALIDRKRRARG